MEDLKYYLLTPLVFVVPICYHLWFKSLSLWVYLALTLLFAFSIVLLILKEKKQKYVILYIFITYLLVISTYYLSTHFSAFMFGDAYWDNAVVKSFVSTGHSNVIGGTIFPSSQLVWYSSWPTIHIIATILTDVLGINSFNVTLLFYFIPAIGSFVFVYLFSEKLRMALKLNYRVTASTLLIFSVFPEVIGFSVFSRQTMAFFLVTIIFYLLCLHLTTPSRKNSLLLILFSFLLVSTHNLSPGVLILYFLILIISASFLSKVRKKDIMNNFLLTLPTITVLLTMFIFLWWTYVGYIVLPSLGTIITRFTEIFSSANVGLAPSANLTPWAANYPVSMTPSWGLNLVLARDIIIYISSALGCLLILKKKDTPHKYLVLLSLLIAVVLFGADFFTINLVPYRFLLLFVPFIGFSGAVLFEYLERKRRYFFHLIVPVLMVVLIFSSFIGLWAHRYVPVNVYDPSINGALIGEHPIDAMKLVPFFESYVVNLSIQRYITDDFYSISLLLPVNEYSKIMRVDNIGAPAVLGNISRVVTVEFNDFNSYSYMDLTNWTWRSTDYNRTLFENTVIQTSNLIYSDGTFKVWETHR
jgi:hypothetical protein